MKRLLCIGKNITKPHDGGEICCLNQEKILKIVFENDFFKFTLPEESFFQVQLNKLFFMFPGMQHRLLRIIAAEIQRLLPDYVYIETSLYGVVAEYLKKRFPNICIISYFHNIEIEYARAYVSFLKPKSWYFYMMAKYNESRAVKYSDLCFSITERDKNLMKKLYGRAADFVMPFSLENKIAQSELKCLDANILSEGRNALFVGSNFFGNTQGLFWFVENVLPHVDIHLTIVGSGMTEVFKNTEKITVFDFVDILDEFYKKSDFVIIPVISGSGMKTKTAEAMMWGKTIVGTRNAFEGFDCLKLPGIYCCKTAQEFVETIKQIRKQKVKLFNREIYNHFSDNLSLQQNAKKVHSFFESFVY